MSAKCQKQTSEPDTKSEPVPGVSTGRRSSFIVADTANLIAGLRVESRFLQWLVGARARPPVTNLFDRSFGGLCIISRPNGAPCLPSISLRSLPLFVGCAVG